MGFPRTGGGWMIKQTLVGIDTSEHSRNAQAYARYLARRLGATVIGLHVVDIVSIEGSFFHDISGSLGLEPYLDFFFQVAGGLTCPSQGVLRHLPAAPPPEGGSCRANSRLRNLRQPVF